MNPLANPLRSAPVFSSRAKADTATDDTRADGTGILPAQAIRALVSAGEIEADLPVEDAQIQPASLDLRLGAKAYRLRASFLPGRGNRVEDRLGDLVMHEVDLTAGAVLETGCVYLVPLQERLSLPTRIGGRANPKSSTGRLDVFTRLICDGATEFDTVAKGYQGPIYAEISPRTFSVLVRSGSKLNQLRLRRGTPSFSDGELRRLHEAERLVGCDGAPDIENGIACSVDLAGAGEGGVIGYRARRHTGVIDLDAEGRYDPADFWDAIPARGQSRLILDPNEFYILVSKEWIHIPPKFAAEMVPIDPMVGEFRVHYAGFFDPGFGNEAVGGQGSRAVLEVRSHEVPFVLEDGQKVARLQFERMGARPSSLYGEDRKDRSYQAQGLKLSRHFQAV